MIDTVGLVLEGSTLTVFSAKLANTTEHGTPKAAADHMATVVDALELCGVPFFTSTNKPAE